jgi:glycerol kinase
VPPSLIRGIAPFGGRASGVASCDGHPVERRARALILAIDQGTTGTTCLVVDDRLRAVGRGYREIRQSFPQPGWVEHDPDEIWASVEQTAAEALADAGVGVGDLAAIGITNQRETTVVWERATGRPVHPAIVWQDRRTADRCAELPPRLIRERTGLVADPYFSATKLEWILGRVELPARQLAFGTIDAWLVWKLTAGSTHVTDLTNASRTMLLDLAAGAWDDELLELFAVDRAVLPEVVRSSGVIGEATLQGGRIPVAGIAGDQQAALFGHGCFTPGEAKATYGTGSFVLVALGEDAGAPAEGLLTTAAAVPPGGASQYAAEGAVLVGGAALQWLRDGLGVIESAADSERLATSVESTAGVTFVPALTGLGSPQWRPDARGLISGLTRGTTRAHLVRAALEAVAHQVADVLDALPLEVGVLRADGGATANGFLMQLQADLVRCPVEVAADADATALGAAALAGLAVGTWSGPDEVAALIRRGARYEPRLSGDDVEQMRQEWRDALRRVLL